MFLIFMPLPYMDASSAWAFRNKWHRTIVGAAGILTELAIASIAAIVWASTSDGTVRAIAYNVIFIASVSTLLFNGNPLLRFDGYYILSDLVEIPNLWQRSRQYIYYLVKRYAWGVRQPQNPAHSTGERGWFVFYGIASTVYRVFICVRILLFLGDRLPKQLFFVAIALSLGAMVTWVLVPLGKFLRYLATNGELLRVRGRAVGSTVGTLVAIITVIGVIPMADRGRVEGVVEPARLAMVHTAVNGFVQEYLPSGRNVSPDGPPLLVAVNPELDVQREQLLAERRRLQARRRIAMTQEVALAQIYAEQIDALEEQLARVKEQLASLSLKAPMEGTWVSPNIEVIKGAYLERGDAVGLVASLDDVIIRAVAPQSIAALIIFETETGRPAAREVEIRLKGRPDIALEGMIKQILPAGQEDLPSAALGYAAGGPVMTKLDDRRGTRAAERFFEIRIAPDPASGVALMSGQRVVIRFEMSSKPLAAQWWRSLLQLFQRRFHV
jgi:putative peptide zinc metalloprotease protein